MDDIVSNFTSVPQSWGQIFTLGYIVVLLTIVSIIVYFKTKKVIIPKFREGIKCKFDRKFTGKIKTTTVSKTPTGKYFISIF